MKIFVYTFCYNEMPILPLVVQYWKRFAFRVIVYDNGSTDGSRDFLAKIPFVELRSYDTAGKLDDFELQRLKNTVWKECRDDSDFAVICDMDECIWANSVENQLQFFKTAKIAAVYPFMCNLISHDFPNVPIDGKTLVHEVVDRYYDDFWPLDDGPGHGLKKKMLVIDPSKVLETNYKVGCYESFPIIESGYKCLETSKILCMHLHDVGLTRKISRYAQRKSRMSQTNIENHLSDFYLEKPSQTIADFMTDLRRSKSVKELIQQSYD